MPDFGVRGHKVVALGGGHGLYATLSALRILTRNVTAIVTVGDDGGSSGHIRKEMDVLPPGDLRMALAALCDDGEWGQTWRDVLQHRFESTGSLNGHSVGNLLIVATWALLDDPVDGLDLIGRLLDVKGRVLPMSTTPLQIEADVLSAGRRRQFVVKLLSPSRGPRWNECTSARRIRPHIHTHLKRSTTLSGLSLVPVRGSRRSSRIYLSRNLLIGSLVRPRRRC